MVMLAVVRSESHCDEHARTRRPALVQQGDDQLRTQWFYASTTYAADILEMKD
jgi:hypothetical protein